MEDLQEEILFETTPSDSLKDIILKARNLIVKNRLRVNFLAFQPYNREETEESKDIKIYASFRVPSFDLIQRIKLNITRLSPLEEKTSPKFIYHILEKFGSEDYMDLSLSEDYNISEKYALNISVSNRAQENRLELPSQITKKDLEQLIQLLDIFKIPYTTNDNLFKVTRLQSRLQSWKTLSYETQARAYIWAIDNNFALHLYSGQYNESSEDYEDRHVSLMESKTIEIFSENPKTRKRKNIYLEIMRPYDFMKEEDISELEDFSKETLGIRFNNPLWKLSYYQIQKEETPKKPEDPNTSKIIG